MRKITLFLLATLFLFAAGCNTPEPELPSEPSQTTTFIEPTTEEETSTEVATTAEETKTQVFSYSEIDSKFGPGPFSVNELAVVFGEPVKLFGTYISNGYFALNAAFEGISFEFVSRNEGLSFDTEDNNSTEWVESPEFAVTPQDKTMKIKPYATTITGANIDFIRGIKIDTSKEKVIAAYDGYAGSERESEEITRLFYTYRPDEIIEFTDDEIFNIASQTGYVLYSFKESKIVEIQIAWYDGYLAFIG